MPNDIGRVEDFDIYTLIEDVSAYRKPFKAQHAVSFLLDIEYQEGEKRVLFDAGSSSEPVLHNMELLGIDPQTIEMIVISHGHYDHCGGLKGLVERINPEEGKETLSLPIFAHPGIFRDRFAVDPVFRYIGCPFQKKSSKDIGGDGARWILTKDPIKLLPGVFVLGEITEEEKMEFEKEKPSMYVIEEGKVKRDTIRDELGLAIVSRNGLNVLTGCAHPGIISMIQKAKNLSPTDTVHSVIGGFHLKNAEKSRIGKTVSYLDGFDVDKIFTGHCTGNKAESKIEKRFKKRFEKLFAGKKLD